MSVRVAVVGVGYLGQHHARIYSELTEAELVAVVDIDPERAEEVARRYETRASGDLNDVLDAVDALSIVSPTTSHYGIALECLKKGKDLLIEKPITVTIDQANELIREAGEGELILQVGHLERYNPGVIALSEMIDCPRFIEAVRVSPFLKRAVDVDVTLDLMIHDIDVVLGLVNSPIKEMRAVGFSYVTGKIDDARAWIEFENNVTACLTASRTAPKIVRKLKVYQEYAYLELNYQNTEIRHYFNPARVGKPYPRGNGSDAVSSVKNGVFSREKGEGYVEDTIKPEYMEPLRGELREFIRSVVTRERPKVSGVEGRDALRVAIEINALIGGVG
jgi:predicted dehydrogenase